MVTLLKLLTIADLPMRMNDATSLLGGQLVHRHSLLGTGVLGHDSSRVMSGRWNEIAEPHKSRDYCDEVMELIV